MDIQGEGASMDTRGSPEVGPTTISLSSPAPRPHPFQNTTSSGKLLLKHFLSHLSRHPYFHSPALEPHRFVFF